MKNIWEVDGDWTCVKEVQGWTINTESVIVALPKQKLPKLIQLLAIPAMQFRIGGKELERLVGKLHYMHLTVTGAVAHL